jgi:hypothetical protein
MRGDRPASRHFSDYRHDDTTGAGARQLNEDFIQAPGAPRRFFKQLAGSTQELAKCFRMAALVPGTSPQGDRFIKEARESIRSDPLHYHDLGNLSEAHTGCDDRIASGGAGSRPESDENVRTAHMAISVDDDVPAMTTILGRQ